MRTKKLLLLFVPFALLLTVCSGDIQAQGFLKKLNKALDKVDKVAKKLDQTATDGLKGVTETKVTNPGYADATVKCSNKNFTIELESCIRDGKLTTLTYYITNNGNDVKIDYWGRREVNDGQTKTSFFDSEGNEYKWLNLTVGKENYNGTDWLSTLTFPEGIKLKCNIVLANVSKKTKQLKKATVSGWNFFLQFNNVSIYTSDEVLAKDKVLFQKDNPTVAELSTKDRDAEKHLLKSVKITETNTQVRVLFQHSSNVTFTANAPDYDANAVLKADGKSYALLTAYGVPTDSYMYGNAYRLNPGESEYLDFVFEKIPENTEKLDIYFGNLYWKGVSLKDAPKLNIPKTTGAMTLDDTFAKFDAKYKKTMTAAEQAKWQISKIFPVSGQEKFFFGKEIYDDNKCRIVTILCRYYEEDADLATEWLIIYDSKGNYVDATIIGTIDYSAASEAVVEGDRLYHVEYGFVYYHKITPDFHFVEVEKDDF